jgi:hypothetical protein
LTLASHHDKASVKRPACFPWGHPRVILAASKSLMKNMFHPSLYASLKVKNWFSTSLLVDTDAN